MYRLIIIKEDVLGSQLIKYVLSNAIKFGLNTIPLMNLIGKKKTRNLEYRRYSAIKIHNDVNLAF